jgi:GNAT superfamily N-acetyltransferase
MIFRDAGRADLPAILALLVDDVLGRDRDSDVVDERYERAFDAVAASPAVRLVVADDESDVVGCMQLTTIPGLSRHGATRLLVEAVRVRSDRRGAGVGAAMMGWAIDNARRDGIATVQLSTDKSRVDAQRFYLRLGFVASHEGMKLQLT